MYLFEFDEGAVQQVKLVVIVAQLKQAKEDGDIPDSISVDTLLDYFQKYDIILDVHDLYNMIKNPPLNNVISNIKGDQVILKGADDDADDAENIDDPEANDKKKTVSNMAKSALSNLQNS